MFGFLIYCAILQQMVCPPPEQPDLYITESVWDYTKRPENKMSWWALNNLRTKKKKKKTTNKDLFIFLTCFAQCYCSFLNVLIFFCFFTADGRVLFEVLSAYVDVFHQALASVSPPLLHRVLGTQGKHCHVFQRQTETAQAAVELLRKTLSHLVALILQSKTTNTPHRTEWQRLRRRRLMKKWFREIWIEMIPHGKGSFWNDINQKHEKQKTKLFLTLMTRAHSWYCSSVIISW